MGEFATYLGESIKIGTCENLYYLRPHQAQLVSPKGGSLDPIREAESIRFRFPWPDEDNLPPGDDGPKHDYDRRLRLDGVSAPEGVEHSSVQFLNQHLGYNVCLPCPESGETIEGVTVHRNGFAGATFLCQQALRGGHLVPILQCACGARWNVPTLQLCEPILASLLAAHDRYCESVTPRPEVSLYSEIHRRILRGFDLEYVAQLGFAAAVPS